MNFNDNAPPSEYSREFIQGMIDRMGMSFTTYGKASEAYPDKVDAIRTLKLKLDAYKETGNTEFLIDVANYAMIEFKYPAHPKAHFRPTDARESKGRVWSDGGEIKKDQNA